MKKIIIGLLLFCLLLTGCNKNEEEIKKVESSLKEENGVYTILLNGKEHTLKISEESSKKSKRKTTVTLDETSILTYNRVYSGKNLYDFEKVSLLKGTDDKYYLVYALGNWNGSAYRQYLYIYNDEAKEIYKNNNTKFGAAFTDYSNVESFDMSSLYGDTGMTKIEEDKVTYLTDLKYRAGEDFVRCQENIITVENDEITETKGNIIKTGRIS